MKCPICYKEMSRLGNSFADGTGDRYTYEFCRICEKEFEIIEDDLFDSGEIEIKEI